MPDAKRPLKVFLCHASVDKPQVLELYQRLKAEPWIDPWLDKAKLLPGQHWSTVIKESLAEADSVIIFISNASVSHEGFSQRELNLAWDYSLEKPRSVIYLIPLRLEDCEVPYDLRERHWANYFGDEKDETYTALLRALKIRHEQKLKLEAEENARQEKVKREREQAEHEAVERTAREKAEREAREQAALKKAKREAAEKAALEKAERNAAEKTAREKTELDAIEKARLENVVPSRTVQPSPEKPVEIKSAVDTEKREIEKPISVAPDIEKTPEKPSRKPKPEYIVATIGAAATLLAALIGILPQFFSPTTGPTETITFSPIATTVFTQIPTSTITVLSPRATNTKTSLPPTKTLLPTPTKLSINSPNKSKLLFFISSKNVLNVLDTSSGAVKELVSVNYNAHSTLQRYSTISWLNDTNILIWSWKNIQVIDVLEGSSQNITPQNSSYGMGSSDISSTQNILVNFAFSSIDEVNLSLVTLSHDSVTSASDIGLNTKKYYEPLCMRWRPGNSMIAMVVSGIQGPIISYPPDLAILRVGYGEEPTIIRKRVDSCISWSPDGKYIVFGNGKPAKATITLDRGIYTIDINSGDVSQLSSTDGYYPVWSSDGKYIAFLTKQGISLINIDSKEEVQVYKGEVEALLWGK